MRTTWFAFSMCISLVTDLSPRAALADPTPSSVWKSDFAAAEAEAKERERAEERARKAAEEEAKRQAAVDAMQCNGAAIGS